MREQAALSNAPEGYLDFHDEYAELIAELAALGFTPTQVLRRLNFLYPHINKKHLNYALDSGIWQFGPVTADAPSYTVLACGLWYVFAEAYDLPPEPEYAALILDCDIIHDLPPALEARHFSNEDIAHVLAKIGATLKYLAAHPYSQLEEEAYAQTLEDIRQRGVKELGTEGGSLYTLLTSTIVATLVAFVVGYLMIGWFLKYVSSKSYGIFIWYRIALGILIFVGLGTGVLNATSSAF